MPSRKSNVLLLHPSPANVCEVIGHIASLLPKEYSQSKLSTYLIELLTDENTDVRKNAAAAAGMFAAAVGNEAIN